MRSTSSRQKKKGRVLLSGTSWAPRVGFVQGGDVGRAVGVCNAGMDESESLYDGEL